MTAVAKRICIGTDQPVAYRPGEIHPHCGACGADLSKWGKGERTYGKTGDDGRWRIFAKRHYAR